MKVTNQKQQAEAETEALQNFATRLNLIVCRFWEEDKRKKTIKYFLAKDGQSISPQLNYEQLNIFMLGYSRCTELFKTMKN